MRRINAVITMCIMILFVIHIIWGGMVLLGMVKGGSPAFSVMSRMLLVLVGIHMIIGTVLTIKTISAVRRAGVFYPKENMLFLIRRISGFALMFFVAVHVFLFMGTGDVGVYRLRLFDAAGLISQILMVVTLLLHVAVNINPLRIALGLSDKADVKGDIAIVLAILLLVSGIAFFVYFLRWRVI